MARLCMGPSSVHVIGDSFAQGQNASAPNKRFQNQLQRVLKETFKTSPRVTTQYGGDGSPIRTLVSRVLGYNVGVENPKWPDVLIIQDAGVTQPELLRQHWMHDHAGPAIVEITGVDANGGIVSIEEDYLLDPGYGYAVNEYVYLEQAGTDPRYPAWGALAQVNTVCSQISKTGMISSLSLVSGGGSGDGAGQGDYALGPAYVRHYDYGRCLKRAIEDVRDRWGGTMLILAMFWDDLSNVNGENWVDSLTAMLEDYPHVRLVNLRPYNNNKSGNIGFFLDRPSIYDPGGGGSGWFVAKDGTNEIRLATWYAPTVAPGTYVGWYWVLQDANGTLTSARQVIGDTIANGFRNFKLASTPPTDAEMYKAILCHPTYISPSTWYETSLYAHYVYHPTDIGLKAVADACAYAISTGAFSYRASRATGRRLVGTINDAAPAMDALKPVFPNFLAAFTYQAGDYVHDTVDGKDYVAKAEVTSVGMWNGGEAYNTGATVACILDGNAYKVTSESPVGAPPWWPTLDYAENDIIGDPSNGQAYIALGAVTGLSPWDASTDYSEGDVVFDWYPENSDTYKALGSISKTASWIPLTAYTIGDKVCDALDTNPTWVYECKADISLSEWSAITSYTDGDYAVDTVDGGVYKCTMDVELDAWVSAAPYDAGDYVTYGTDSFKAKTTHSGVVTPPDVDGTNWELTTECNPSELTSNWEVTTECNPSVDTARWTGVLTSNPIHDSANWELCYDFHPFMSPESWALYTDACPSENSTDWEATTEFSPSLNPELWEQV